MSDVAEAELTREESYVLADAAEWGGGSFTFLAWLGSKERHPEKAAEMVERLLGRGLLEIEASEPDAPPHVLGREEALAAIRDPRKWRDPEEEPFAPGETAYAASTTAAGLALLQQNGWQPD